MADQTITSTSYVAVTLPGSACKMQVHDARVAVTFGTDDTTRGLILDPGDAISLAAGDVMRARRVDRMAPVLSFEVFG